MTRGIQLKTRAEIEKMRAAGRVVHQVHNLCREMCKPGVTTKEIDEAAGEYIAKQGGTGLFKNYPTYKPGEGFPSHLCISVNEVVVHGIADDREIEDGDCVGIDCGVKLDGWCGDAATTIMVGNVSQENRQLCEDTQHVLQIAIENMRPGRNWSQVARLMQRFAENKGYGVVREFVGHGIGRTLHEAPSVPNYDVTTDKKGRKFANGDFLLKEGMVLAVEPMCNLGTHQTRVLDDQWTVVTLDGKCSAHYEHTLAVTADGVEILTDGK